MRKERKRGEKKRKREKKNKRNNFLIFNIKEYHSGIFGLKPENRQSWVSWAQLGNHFWKIKTNQSSNQNYEPSKQPLKLSSRVMGDWEVNKVSRCEQVWAGMSWCEMVWDGMSWKRMSWDKLEWAGVSWSELRWDGVSWGGLGWVGRKWAEMSSSELERAEMSWKELERAEMSWKELRGAGFILVFFQNSEKKCFP